MQATAQYFGKRFFINQVLEFHGLSKFLCHTSVAEFMDPFKKGELKPA
jgi:hypothetical protein